ncbi:MAG: HPF/RaiA family ribosome-associated protein [Chryseosolibacter sp.]
MKITIQTPDFKPSERLMDFVAGQVEKLSVLSDRIIDAQVVLKKEKSATDADKVCELKLAIPGNDIFASRQSATFEDAVTETIEAVRNQLKKWKDSRNPQKMRPTPKLGPQEGA